MKTILTCDRKDCNKQAYGLIKFGGLSHVSALFCKSHYHRVIKESEDRNESIEYRRL